MRTWLFDSESALELNPEVVTLKNTLKTSNGADKTYYNLASLLFPEEKNTFCSIPFISGVEGV
jgi:hypothetical protein